MEVLYISPRSSLNTIVLPKCDVTLGRRKAIFAPLSPSRA